MKSEAINTQSDYENALKSLEVIFDSPINSLEGDEAEILSMMIENYENIHFPIEAPNPIETTNLLI